MKTILILCLSFFFYLSANACRTNMGHQYLSQKEALKAANLVLSGVLEISKADKKGDFKKNYVFKKGSKLWKGDKSLLNFNFEIEHHTCAKYRSEFSTETLVIGYFKKNGNDMALLRLVPSEDSWNDSSGGTTDNEIKFLDQNK